MRSTILLVFLSLAGLNYGYAQTNLTFGGYDNDIGYALTRTISGGYLLVGTTRSFGMGRSDFAHFSGHSR